LRLLHDGRQARGHPETDGPEQQRELRQKSRERERRVETERNARRLEEEDRRHSRQRAAQPAQDERRDAPQPDLDDDEVDAPEDDDEQRERGVARTQGREVVPRSLVQTRRSAAILGPPRGWAGPSGFLRRAR